MTNHINRKQFAAAIRCHPQATVVSEPAGQGAPKHLVVGSQNSEALKTAFRWLRGMSNVPHGSPAQQLGRLVPSAVATAALPTVIRWTSTIPTDKINGLPDDQLRYQVCSGDAG
eukprot:scpid46810/ scgid18787/ 